MTKLKVFEAFSGVGSQRMALRNLSIPHEVVAISEIDEYAIKSYNTIHGETLNLGDISQIHIDEIPDHDLFTYSFPCQDISKLGKEKGLEEGSETRSSLLWECKRVIESKTPKYLMLENVKNLASKTHKINFEKWLKWLENKGYKNYWKVLNASNYGIPQNRERVFVISILNNIEFEFPKPIENMPNVKNFLEDGYKYEDFIEDSLKIDERIKRGCKIEFAKHYDKIINSDKQIYDCKAKTDFQDKKVGIKVSPCLKAQNSNIHILNGKRIQRITPKESWLLMGFKDEDFDKVKDTGISNTQLYKLAGNSIVVNVLEEIFKNLFKEYIK